MRNSSINRILLMMVAAALIGVLSACGANPTPPPQDSMSREEQDATTIANQIYRGLQNDALGAHTAEFTAEFAPSDGSAGWTFATMLEHGENQRRVLTIDGLPANVDPGDVTLISVGDRQYMTGEAVGVSRCLLFPADVDLDDSFLTPDAFLPPISVPDSALTKGAEETVAGQVGTVYTFENAAIGGLTNATGSIVLAENGAVLRSTVEGDMLDDKLLNGVEGHINWNYVVTSVGAGEAINVPAECVVDLPVMDDAEDLARLPNLIQYATDGTLEELQAFYDTELKALGWGVYEFPQVREESTVLTYAKDGVILSVSIEAEGGKRLVQLFTEDR